MRTQRISLMMQNALKTVLTLCGCLSLGACMNIVPPHHQIDHYILEYPPPQAEAGAPTGVAISLGRFRVAPQYNSTRIFYRPSEFKLTAYAYHRWRSHPGEMATFFLARDLRQSGLFDGVFVVDTRADTACRIEGLVEELYEDDTGPDRAAVLTITVTLLRTDVADMTKQLLFQKTYNAREPCGDRTPAEMVAAMSRSMARVSSGIVRDVYRKLSCPED